MVEPACRKGRRGRAWMAGLGLAGLAAATPARADEFVCRGRDPGWELTAKAEQASLTAERIKARAFTGSAVSLAAEGVIVWRGRSAEGGRDLVAVMLKGACTDPAADATMTHSGIVSLPSAGVVVGCCTYAPGRLPATEAAPALLPQAEAAEVPAGERPEPPPAAPASGKAPDKVPGQASPQVAALPKAAEAAKPAAAPKPAAALLAVGARSQVAGSARVRVLVRATPDGRGRVLGKISGGRSVTIDRQALKDGQAWYRIRGIGVPAGAWVRGDMLRGG